jgi:hypothetical protein
LRSIKPSVTYGLVELACSGRSRIALLGAESGHTTRIAAKWDAINTHSSRQKLLRCVIGY